MANSEYSYYFTVVIYPDEFTRLSALLEIGFIYLSPIHFNSNYNYNISNTTEIVRTVNFTIGKEKKRHQHILFKTSNKLTANRFIEKLTSVLNKDFTGIALYKDECLVYKPEMMLRYFYHLDNPDKEHFNILTAFEDVAPCFTREVCKAFEVEITHIITNGILTGEFKTMRDIINYNSCSLVFEEYLRCTKNLYYVRNFFLDERYLEQKRKDYELYEKNRNSNSLPY